MMQKKNRKQWAALKLILFLPLLVILLQAFARPEILVEKASEFVPMIAQQDSSEVWLNNWTIKNISNINGGLITKKVEVKPPPPNYPKSGLPKYDKSRDGHPIPSANIFPILINRNNDLLAANKRISQKEIERGVERFLTGNHPFEDSKTGPEFVDVNLPNIGKRNISKGVIIVQYDRDTDEKTIEDILRNIGRAHLNVREQRAKMEFGKEYFSLSAVQRSAIDQIVPIRVSVVSPKIVSPPPPPPPKVVEVLSIILKNDNKDIDYDNIRESAEKHLKTPNHSDYVIVSAEEGISEDDIEKVKKELLMAGIKSVKVVSNSDIK